MNWIEGIILGIIQGLTEFLPVSSSGHLELGKIIFGIESSESMFFTLSVHGATVLSTIIIFYKEILALIKGLFKFKWNWETKYCLMIIVSMIPVLIVGLLLEDFVNSLFSNNLFLVGSALIFTAILLGFTFFSKEVKTKEISFLDSFIVGIAQAIAVVPGISRSGSTIATGLLLGNKKSEVSKFSFLMVLAPIIGANILKLLKTDNLFAENSIDFLPILLGFIAAFITGLFACKLMIKIVNNSKLIYFSIYCFIIGAVAIIYSCFGL